jgi:hypothetical protein
MTKKDWLLVIALLIFAFLISLTLFIVFDLNSVDCAGWGIGKKCTRN